MSASIQNKSMNGNSSLMFECFCGKYYKGQYCESKIDICQNETCSGNGHCEDVNKQAKCKCFSLYLGEKCETKSNELEIIQTVLSTASIVAIIAVFLFYLCILSMDMAKICTKNKNKKRKKKNWKKNC